MQQQPAPKPKKKIRVPRVINGIEQMVEIEVDEDSGPGWGPNDKHSLLNHPMQRVDGPLKAAGVARYTRGQMLEVIRQDYVRTARAKGLPESTVIMKHALRNSLIPVVTLLGLYLPFLFSGAVFVEYIFAWPGMGRVIVDAIFQRDYPLIMATSFLFAVMVVLGNLLADVLYSVVDPRIRYD